MKNLTFLLLALVWVGQVHASNCEPKDENQNIIRTTLNAGGITFTEINGEATDGGPKVYRAMVTCGQMMGIVQLPIDMTISLTEGGCTGLTNRDNQYQLIECK